MWMKDFHEITQGDHHHNQRSPTTKKENMQNHHTRMTEFHKIKNKIKKIHIST